MAMILVFTGKNQNEALSPIGQVTEDWTMLKARHPQNLGFENALRQNARINGINMPDKLYFGIIDHELIVDRLSAKLQIPEIITAFDAEVVDWFDDDVDAQRKVESLWKEHTKEWDRLSGGNGRLPRDQGNALKRLYKQNAERLWNELLTELLSKIDLWDEED